MTEANRPALLEIASAFLRLGLTSFGGPIAHLGYFRSELIQRRRWISDDSYAEILALSQFLPGPASSQVAFALGWQRGGFAGALLATLAFTLPSALTMILLAALAGSTPPETGLAGGLVAGLKITAVAIVAHAVLGMARSLAPTGARAGIALAALAMIALLPAEAIVQVAAILLGAGLGFVFRVAPPLREMATPPLRALSRKGGAYCLATFTVLLIGLPLLATIGWPVELADIFYRAGALVFGGGHVVLPLLQNGTQGLVSDASFLAGYGAAQAMPGPLFTFAGWLGQVTGGLPGAVIALVAIFLPGFLLMAGAMPFWAALSRISNARHAMAGANAAVVGILGHALYEPVFTSGIRGDADLALAVALFLMLGLWGRPAWQVVIAGALGGMALSGLV
ncbi:chromate efflux transporter [Paracoccus onubensis]|nr:chromate efflux transporter [Paracoccus onubensis]